MAYMAVKMGSLELVSRRLNVQNNMDGKNLNSGHVQYII